MGAKLILLVLCATAVSSRHLVDVNTYLVPFVPSPDTQRHNSEIVLERRNIEYGSKTNLNGPNVQPLYRQDSDVNRRIPERHTHRYHNHEVSESSDSNNNIGYTQDEYKLRTNVPSASYTYTTEYMTSDMTVYTNLKPETNTRTSDVTQERLPKETVREPNIDQYYRHGDVQDTHNTPITPKTNKNTITNNNDQSNTNNHVTSPVDQNNLMHQNDVNTNESVNIRRSKPKTNQSGEPKISRTNETRPTADRGKAMDNIPNRKEEEEEIAWVWGTEPADKETTTEKDGLIDRAAFSGDQCPTGKTKVEGMCVDKH